MKELVYLAIGTLILAMFFEFLYFGKGVILRKRLSRIVLIWFLTTLFPYLAYNIYHTNKLLSQINSSATYSKAKKVIANKSNTCEREIFEIGWESIEDYLYKLTSEDKVYIQRKYIGDVWNKLLNNAISGSEILATNCVMPNDWKFNFDTVLGIKTQKNTISRGVFIKRILITDKNINGHRKGQEEIFNILKAELNSDFYKSSIISIEQLKTNHFDPNEIEKYKDIAIIKIDKTRELLFITDLHKDYTIKGAWVSTNKDEIEKVRQFYVKLWGELK